MGGRNNKLSDQKGQDPKGVRQAKKLTYINFSSLLNCQRFCRPQATTKVSSRFQPRLIYLEKSHEIP